MELAQPFVVGFIPRAHIASSFQDSNEFFQHFAEKVLMIVNEAKANSESVESANGEPDPHT
jgi:hypothetical protein